jgi:predicted ATPase
VFTRIEAKNYRCLKEVSQPLNPFEILVGPNGSGKSTFLDVIGFLSDFASDGLVAALERRTEHFEDLVFRGLGTGFLLSIDLKSPKENLPPGYVAVRYDVMFGLDSSDEFSARHQYIRLIPEGAGPDPIQLPRWNNNPSRESVLGDEPSRLVSDALRLAPSPAVSWLRGALRDGIRTVELDARLLRRPSPAGSAADRRITGAGLARSVWNLKSPHPQGFADWLSHVRTALPEIRDIHSIPREWENSRYVMIEYQDGIRVPSWTVSEGTLRLLQLTILAYLPDYHGVYLIEEPENGVHPSALETIYQSLSTIYGVQVLVSSHSPILLNMAKPEQLLCFSKSPDGIKIVRGNEHPALKDWQNEVSLGTLAASGILG